MAKGDSSPGALCGGRYLFFLVIGLVGGGYGSLRFGVGGY